MAIMRKRGRNMTFPVGQKSIPQHDESQRDNDMRKSTSPTMTDVAGMISLGEIDLSK